MVASMTGFARQSLEADWGALVWELKTVNHRFLEISLRLPENLKQIESQAREVIQQQLRRGSLEATLRFKPGDEMPFEFELNQSLLKQLAQACESLSKHFPASTISQVELLQWPGVMAVKQTNKESLEQAALALLSQTLLELCESRRREGQRLETFLRQRLATIRTCASQIEAQLPEICDNLRAKTLARFEALSVEVNNERLEQEMVWLLQKMDVAEELQRLRSHVSEFERVLQQEAVAGRRLDFLTQELNREANTLGSKSVVGEVSQAAVELKVQIEQIREQVQNIE